MPASDPIRHAMATWLACLKEANTKTLADLEARGVTMPKAHNMIRIEMSRDDALALGLLVCECGHPPNNHFHFDFNDDRPCAHCDCRKYRERARRGRLTRRTR